MRISFDLDDTLICLHDGVQHERKLPWFVRRLGLNEPLRRGTLDLILRLKQLDWEIWVYTTSNRNIMATTWWFRLHGIRIDGMVNQRAHAARIAQLDLKRCPSKLPSAFEIDLHVDDSPGVADEGNQFGFAVTVVDPHDDSWTEKVLTAAAKARERIAAECKSTHRTA